MLQEARFISLILKTELYIIYYVYVCVCVYFVRFYISLPLGLSSIFGYCEYIAIYINGLIILIYSSELPIPISSPPLLLNLNS